MTKRTSRPPLLSILALVAIVASLASYALTRMPWQRAALPAVDGPAIATAKTWGYQLQGFEPDRVPAHVDLLVTDYSRDGTEGSALSVRDVAQLKRRADGGRRIVLSYLSIGEAETYRYYWMPTWKMSRPSWLGVENPEWKGNHPVRYWDKAWQDIIFRPQTTWLDRAAEYVLPWRKPYLDRIIEAGFDGVYLDRVDVFSEFEDTRKTAKRDMIAFVTRLAQYARARRPGFLIVPQNGEDLLSNRGYVGLIDAIAKEDLLYGASEDRKPNAPREVAEAIKQLDRVAAAGKPVMMVEYVDDPVQQAKTVLTARQKGYVPLFARRALDVMPEPVPVLPEPVPAAASGPAPPTAPLAGAPVGPSPGAPAQPMPAASPPAASPKL